MRTPGRTSPSNRERPWPNILVIDALFDKRLSRLVPVLVVVRDHSGFGGLDNVRHTCPPFALRASRTLIAERKKRTPLTSACQPPSAGAYGATEFLHGKNIWRLYKTYGRMIGVPQLKPHDLRQGAAMEGIGNKKSDSNTRRRTETEFNDLRVRGRCSTASRKFDVAFPPSLLDSSRRPRGTVRHRYHPA